MDRTCMALSLSATRIGGRNGEWCAPEDGPEWRSAGRELALGRLRDAGGVGDGPLGE